MGVPFRKDVANVEGPGQGVGYALSDGSRNAVREGSMKRGNAKSTAVGGAALAIAFGLAFLFAMLMHLNVFSKAGTIGDATGKIMAAHGIPACAVVTYANSAFGFDSYGRANGPTVSDTSLFVIGSTTKAFTGLAVQLAADDGLIDLDAGVSRYIPWLSFRYEGKPTDVTIRQLLSHCSGIPYATLFNLPQGDHEGVIGESVRAINGMELDFVPGSRYRYVNMNYTVLACLLETVTGESYESYVKERILAPLGMDHSSLYLDEARRKDRFVTGSRTFFGMPMAYDAELEGANKPAGGMITCTADLAKWINAQMGGEGVPENLRAAIARTHDIAQCAYVPRSGQDYYLFGWHVSADGKTIMHTGGVENYGSCVILDLGSDTAVAVLCNGMLAPAVYIAENYISSLKGANAFSIRFASVATLDIICSALCLLLLYFIIATVRKLATAGGPLPKTSTLIIRMALLGCGAIALAFSPYLVGFPYSMLWKESALTLSICIFEGLALCLLKLFRNASLLRKKSGTVRA